jgi:hypothetical protein
MSERSVGIRKGNSLRLLSDRIPVGKRPRCESVWMVFGFGIRKESERLRLLLWRFGRVAFVFFVTVAVGSYTSVSPSSCRAVGSREIVVVSYCTAVWSTNRVVVSYCTAVWSTDRVVVSSCGAVGSDDFVMVSGYSTIASKKFVLNQPATVF